ncbi:PREDICTED: BEL1-like homeodomain protein 10 [Camelina sativa]|uniref:BEL1-like homeodomain protein 10 n=1 Tax=Camelina sativa TaxID=90675 RepID=A0ABM0WWK0_CAMSA|nr:PREDICTED: BEL1-like homeodomain protein 10 [Camelina sativa]XP_019095198.1 PREDICTED: BEL1-like homeodomain protein 10 [Camelina sativa]XP_019095199.1 PREDICTED: BEL1-like homeodomain protein 10 [Camelina sativa]XP_019095200.1 PREDICTED: BEL1-like homeodomain protein 10 [Camelina sativa]
MAVYYTSNVGCYQQEPIFLNHQQQQQQQQASSSSAAASFTVTGGDNVRNEMVFIPPTTGDVVTVNDAVSSSDLSFHDGQGLSLSLGTQISVPPFQYHQYQLGFTQNPSLSSVRETSTYNVDELSVKSKEMLLLGQSDPSSVYAGNGGNGFYNNYRYNETSGGFMSGVLRSRYLKPAQSLLDEVVSVKKELNQMGNKKMKVNDFNNGSKEIGRGGNGELSSDSNGKPIELSTIEREELQNKKNKLLTMVDEVDKRYNQYYHQMEALASSFEIVAGLGSAKPYTSVALNRISRHFRALRDAIKEQIQIIRDKLGEKGGESLDDQQGERIPRLRYLDQRLRQQRALHQQLGMVRPAWRPQRGLPENSVSVLRAWLFEHFLHPYPKESEKIMLAKQTGLSKNQVANWFINARVRLWKPMIEEMYKEEFGDESELLISKSSQEPNCTNQEDSSSKQHQQENNNNNLTYSSVDTTNIAFSSEIKPDRVSGNEDEPQQQQQQQQMNRSADYDTLMNYQGFGLDDYRYIGGSNQQESRFSNSHHLHDFVV